MDEGDYGQDYQARLNEEAIAKHRLQAEERRLKPQDLQSLECSWCEDEIPEARRAAIPGCSLCTECQTMKERFPERMI